MDRYTEKIKRRYNRTALFYDHLDMFISPGKRREVLQSARGKVLEVGVGTGRNLPLYPQECSLTGIDFSTVMLEKAQQRIDELNIAVDLQEMDIQELTFPGDSFDTVVATCVFCSVPYPVAGLKEVRRVCKKDGQVILLEHVRSESMVAGFLLDLINPLTVTFIGDHVNRRTVENVQEAGLEIKELKKMGHLLRLIKAAP